MYENETYFDRTTCSEEELKQRETPYDKKADKTARKEARAAKKAEIKAAKAAASARKEARSSGGMGRKVMISVSLGLCFGLFAGLGFYAVRLGTDHFFPAESDNAIITELPENLVNLPVTDKKPDSPVSYVSYVVDDVSDMVEDVMPAMVAIVKNYTSTGLNPWGQIYQKTNVSGGSGIIVGETDTELLIATNNHVVEDAESLDITFIDNSTAQAVVKGTDTDMDIAVIAVPVSALSQETLDSIVVARLGNSDELKLGRPVVAIGNALGYGQSVTNGIISALDREMTSEDGSTGRYIQTNAAINHGNSGGALLNMNGEVIGINVARIDDGVVSVEGMGFAIPINAAEPIISELMQRETRIEKVEEGDMGYMGVTMQTVTEEVSAMFGFPRGVFVREVSKGSAAEAAGIRVGDIIVKFDGQRISSNADLLETIQYFKAGETVTVTVKRSENGEYVDRKIEVTLGSRPAENE